MITSRSPQMDELIDEMIRLQILGIHTSLPARVVDVNKENGKIKSVDVQLELKNILKGKFVSFPTLRELPIKFPRGGGYVMTFPLKIGDKGAVDFFERSMDEWKQDGREASPRQIRTHDLTDGTFYPGVYSFDNPTPIDDTDAVFGREDKAGEVRISDNGAVTVTSPDLKLGSDSASEPFILGNKFKGWADSVDSNLAKLNAFSATAIAPGPAGGAVPPVPALVGPIFPLDGLSSKVTGE